MRLFFVLSAFFFAANLVAQPYQQPKPLTLATYAYDQNSRIDNLLPLARHLQEQLQRPVQAVSYPSVPDLLAAIKAQKVDIALLNTYGFLQIAQDPKPRMRPLMVLEPAPGQQNPYGGCLFALKSTGIHQLSDLATQGSAVRLVMAGATSTSGNYVQRLLLRQKGFPDPEYLFKEVRYAGSHAQVVQQVKGGVAQVGACGYDELQHQLQTGKLQKEDITVLWTSGEIPLGPVLVKNSLPRATQARLQKILAQLHTQNPLAFDALRQGWTEARTASHFRPVSPQHYQETVKALLGKTHR